MFKHNRFYILIVLLLLVIPNQFIVAEAASFNKKINKIQKEINKDNVKEATRLLKKIKISSSRCRASARDFRPAAYAFKSLQPSIGVLDILPQHR